MIEPFHSDYDELTVHESRMLHRVSVWLDESRPIRNAGEDRRRMAAKRIELEAWLNEQGWEKNVDYFLNIDRVGVVDWYYFNTKSMAMMFKLGAL